MQDPLIINKETVEEIIKKSKEVSRKRALHLREYLDGGNNIGLIYNAFQMGTYVQPHKHPSDGTEIWVAQKGTVRAILFNEEGNVVQHYDISLSDNPFLLIPAGTYHTAVAMEPDSVLCEIYLGKFNPETYKEFASWAPSEEGSEQDRERYLKKLIDETGTDQNENTL